MCIFILTGYEVKAKCRGVDIQLKFLDLTKNDIHDLFIISASILSSISLYYILFVVVIGFVMVIRKKDTTTCQVYMVMTLQVLHQKGT